MTRRYSVVLTPEPDGSALNVTSPDFPELVTFGYTREEALAMARDCAEALILTYLDRGHEIPEEGGRAEVATIEVDLDALRAQLAAEQEANSAYVAGPS
jgi:predicted RNase H-like HicB family nuclease